jgi:hypothetical protein
MHIIRYDSNEDGTSGDLLEEVLDVLAPGDSLHVTPTNHGEFKTTISVKDELTRGIVVGTLTQLGIDDTAVTEE